MATDEAPKEKPRGKIVRICGKWALQCELPPGHDAPCCWLTTEEQVDAMSNVLRPIFEKWAQEREEEILRIVTEGPSDDH